MLIGAQESKDTTRGALMGVEGRFFGVGPLERVFQMSRVLDFADEA